jgi:hypothetical protein
MAEGRVLKFSIALFVLAAVVRAACVSNPGGTTEELCLLFRTSLSVEDRMSQAASVFNPNEPIGFDLLIANTLNEPATLTASSSCTAVVFEVTDSAQRRRWGSADQIACIQMLQPRTYAPLETVSEPATWDQRDSDGVAVPPGRYTVIAAVGQYVSDTQGMVDCRAPLSQSATFTIQ